MNDKGFPAKGTYVSRSAYQKVCEENKRLKIDIYTLVMSDIPHETGLWMDVYDKWVAQFTKDAEFKRMMKEYAIQYFKDHPEELIQIENPKP